MSGESEAGRGKRLLAFLGLVLLYLLSSWRFPWQRPAGVLIWLRPSPDLALLLALGLLCVWRMGMRALVTHALTSALVMALVFHAAATAMPAFYYRPFVIYHDILFVPDLIHLLLHEQGFWAQKALLAAGLACFLGSYLLLYGVVRAVLRLGFEKRMALRFAGICGLLGLIGLFTPLWSPGRLLGLTRNVARIPRDIRLHRLYVEGLVEYEREAHERQAQLAGLAGVDVYVLFIESYGRVLLDKPAIAARFRAWAAVWEAELTEAGFASKSVYAAPPGKGGGSSWGHMQLLSGVPVSNARHFDIVLESALRPLPGLLSAAGHRAVMVQPMMDVPWPAGQSFYGFDDDIYRSFFPYDGFRYHWGSVPDQYSLAYLLDEIVEPSTQPLFLLYVSISSHAPFKNIPPFLEDWEAVLAPGAFADDPVLTYEVDFFNYKRHPDAEEAYVEAMRYSMQTMTGFARQLQRPSLVFILGDHQPPSLSGFEGYDDSRHVPLHILSNRADLLAPFAKMTDGLIPDPEAPALSTQRFLSLFTQAFEGGR